MGRKCRWCSIAVAAGAFFLLSCGGDNGTDVAMKPLPEINGTFSGIIPATEYAPGGGDTLRLDSMFLNLFLGVADSAHLFTVVDTAGDERYRNSGHWFVPCDSIVVFVASECRVNEETVADSLQLLCQTPVELKILNEDSLLITLGSLAVTASMLGYNLESMLQGTWGQLMASFGIPLVREK